MMMGKNWKRSVRYLQFGLPGLVLSLALACASASTPVGSTPPVSTGTTPVVDGADQTPREASEESATPKSAPTRVPKATSEKSGEIPATANAPKDTSESIRRRDGAGGDDQALPLLEKGELSYPNLGSSLDELVASVEAGETTAEQAASRAHLHSGASVAVTIYLSGNVDEVVAFLEENGGDPRNVGEDYIEAYVPVPLLGLVSERPGVIRVRQIIPPAPGRRG